jgi:hypothetical protein
VLYISTAGSWTVGGRESADSGLHGNDALGITGLGGLGPLHTSPTGFAPSGVKGCLKSGLETKDILKQ